LFLFSSFFLSSEHRITLFFLPSVYVRNIRSGAVSLVMGPKTYMMAVDEILYQKELSSTVETLLLCAYLSFLPVVSHHSR